MYTLLQSHCNLIQQCKTEVDKAVCTTIITKSIIYKFLFFIQFLCATKITISLMESSTHIYLLKITCRNIADKIIAFESLTFWWKQPMIFVPDENYVMIQPLFIVLSVVTPFVSGLIERVTPPLPPSSQVIFSLIANLHQLSCHSKLWMAFHSLQGRSSISRILWSLPRPGCSCMKEQEDDKSSLFL